MRGGALRLTRAVWREKHVLPTAAPQARTRSNPAIRPPLAAAIAAPLLRRLPDGVISSHPIVDALGRTQQTMFVTEAGMNMVIWRSAATPAPTGSRNATPSPAQRGPIGAHNPPGQPELNSDRPGPAASHALRSRIRRGRDELTCHQSVDPRLNRRRLGSIITTQMVMQLVQDRRHRNMLAHPITNPDRRCLMVVASAHTSGQRRPPHDRARSLTPGYRIPQRHTHDPRQ